MILAATCETPPQPLSVRANALFNIIGCLMYQGCLWVTTVAVVILSGYEASGTLAYAMAIGNIFLSIASFNIRIYQVSDISGEYTTGAYFAFRLITIAIAFLIMIPYTLLSTSDRTLLAPVGIYLLFKMDEAFCDVLYGTDQKNQRMDYIGISQFVRGIAIIASFSLALYLTDEITLAFSAMFVSSLAMTLLYDLPRARRFGAIDLSIGKSEVFGLFKRGLPIVISATLYSSIPSIARQQFGNQFGAESLGYYAAIATPSVLIQAAARYLYAPALVPLAEHWNECRKKRFLSLYIQVLLIMLASAIASTCLLAFAGPSLLGIIYGDSVAPYTYLLPGVMVATSCIAYVNFLADTLVLCRNFRTMMVASATGFLCCILSSNHWESLMGMQGINITIILSTLLILIISLVRTLLNLRSLDKSPAWNESI